MAKTRRRRFSGAVPWLFRKLFNGFLWVFAHVQVVAAMAILVGFVAGVWIVATRSPAFAITTITVPAGVNVKVPQSLIGQNLWTVDLKALELSLNAQQKDLKHLRAIRRVPHTLEIEAALRTPVAQIKLGQWYPVDREGYVLSQGKTAPWDALVALKGVDAPNARVRAGRANPTDRMLRALRLAVLLQRSPELVHHRLQAVDIGDPVSLKLVVDDIEIRCGNETQLATGLQRLRDVLRTVAVDSMPVRYIDVRFHDPVMGVKG